VANAKFISFLNRIFFENDSTNDKLNRSKRLIMHKLTTVLRFMLFELNRFKKRQQYGLGHTEERKLHDVHSVIQI